MYLAVSALVLCSEMLEAVGHEFYTEWFRRCDHLLAKDGLLVVQVLTIFYLLSTTQMLV
jgi:cyclopropane fatty-acyl-phospholipid synthase-like methyltransferase